MKRSIAVSRTIEQQVPVALEWDEWDSPSLHAVARIDNQPIGTARLLPHGKIGRVAVLASWRGQGIGNQLLQTLIQAAHEQGLTKVSLDAQTHAIGFCQRHGFETEGKAFLDAGIPHRHMAYAI